MYEVVTPCPDCGSHEIGHQFMQAEDATGRCMAPRRCCGRCGWRGPVLWLHGEDLDWKPITEPTFPANWRAIADALVYGFKVGDEESEREALDSYWDAGGQVLMDLSDDKASTTAEEDS
jgi:hypothetical protein